MLFYGGVDCFGASCQVEVDQLLQLANKQDVKFTSLPSGCLPRYPTHQGQVVRPIFTAEVNNK